MTPPPPFRGSVEYPLKVHYRAYEQEFAFHNFLTEKQYISVQFETKLLTWLHISFFILLLSFSMLSQLDWFFR